MDEVIRSLTEAYGPSGFEDPVRSLLRSMVAPLADEVRITPLGSLVAVRRGTGNGRRMMLAAHMDEIGVMVTYVDEKGFLRFTPIGGVSPLTCVGARVRFENGVLGVIGVEKREDPHKVPSFEQLYIDVGATGREDCPVRVGDAAVFERPFVAQGRRLVAKAMDDRIGCAVLVETLTRLGPTPHEVYFVFSVQEETTLSGARTAAYGIEPDMAIAVDVTRTGDTPESQPMAVELGKGPAIKVQDAGMIAHPAVREWLMRAAETAGIPYQMEVLERGTTDASAVQLVRAGIPSGCLSIPCRYIHTPSEMVDREDVEGAVRLLLQALEGSSQESVTRNASR
ncbi:MAG: M42 family metallopeptidase [Anaerolineae bacterium]|nr:M42 family metallopeptidase [Anaerolineae bacterium]MDW8069601.1 M42 family metallopeptidase [Anaerolineae bacterium]